MMKNDREKLFRFITEVGFAIDDILLYLDTHPCDKQAMEYYDSYRKLYTQAAAEYSKNYGPLTVDDVNSCNYWAWVKDPWPWEVTGRSVCK